MSPTTVRASEPEASRQGSARRIARGIVFCFTLLFVVAALVISTALVIYTAYLHDPKNGVFALIFAILSAQVALNWLLWRGDEE